MTVLLVIGLIFLLCLFLVFAALIKMIAHIWQMSEMDDSPWGTPEPDTSNMADAPRESVFNRFDLVFESSLELSPPLLELSSSLVEIPEMSVQEMA
ncbi:hypothetical protein [Pseudanabaena sp. FACHB-2040]|uniref:hypothetical protein n=1 Tax=Pseudanabaena sp. FACHB-2040 TaxID=2692859 RepID=UPI00168322C8|nr:hypothetical protein [Pseudanabaena sp. FACHB-2040]MBD2260515.1 hypothetical protein [Pseudanabaena sp. FACHB-2040]